MKKRDSGVGLIWSWCGLIAVAMVSMFAAMGCGDSGPASGSREEMLDEGAIPEVVAVRKAFESAKPSLKNPVYELLKTVKAGSENRLAYTDALPTLQRLAQNPDLTPEQKSALEDLIGVIRSRLTSGAPR